MCWENGAIGGGSDDWALVDGHSTVTIGFSSRMGVPISPPSTHPRVGPFEGRSGSPLCLWSCHLSQDVLLLLPLLSHSAWNLFPGGWLLRLPRPTCVCPTSCPERVWPAAHYWFCPSGCLLQGLTPGGWHWAGWGASGLHKALNVFCGDLRSTACWVRDRLWGVWLQGMPGKGFLTSYSCHSSLVP